MIQKITGSKIKALQLGRTSDLSVTVVRDEDRFSDLVVLGGRYCENTVTDLPLAK
jgi:hypothetical protein